MAKDLALAKIDRVNTALAQVVTMPEANHVVGMAAAALTYTRQVDASIETKNLASKVYLKCKRRRGELVAAMKKAGKLARGTKGKGQPPHKGRKLGDSQTEPPNSPTLGDLGISKKASRWNSNSLWGNFPQWQVATPERTGSGWNMWMPRTRFERPAGRTARTSAQAQNVAGGEELPADFTAS